MYAGYGPAAKHRQIDAQNITVVRHPGKRLQISSFPFDALEAIRRMYFLAGPFCDDAVAPADHRSFVL